MRSNYSILIIYAIWLKFSILKILSRKKKKKKSSYRTTVITIWFWFVKHGWNFANNLYIKNEIMYNFVIKITMDEVYYVKYYFQAWLWWKILYSFFFFFWFFIFICCIPNYTIFVYLLEFKKIISFFYKKDYVSRCMYIHIKVDNFV